MIKLTKELIKEIGNDIMLPISDKQADEIYKTEGKSIKEFAELNKLDLENIEPMFFPYDYENSFMREDENPLTISKEYVMNNAPLKDDKYILIKKVVK